MSPFANRALASVLVVLFNATWLTGQKHRDIRVLRTETNSVDVQPVRGDRFSLGIYHALLIAIEDYAPHHPNLETPSADARALRDVLVDDFCFDHENVMILHDVAASREGILDALDGLAQRLDRDDNLLIFYAGHGTARWRLEDFAEGFWVPHGATARWSTWLSSHTLRRAIARIRARHVFVISDSCFSGSMNDREVRVDDIPEDIRRFARDPSCQLLASGQWEAVSDAGRDGHSVFAWHLLRSLQNTQGYLTARDLASDLIGDFRAMLRRREVDQMPEWDAELIRSLGSSGQFVFVRNPQQREAGTGPTGRSERTADQPGVPAGWMLPPRVRAVATATAARSPETVRRFSFMHDEFGHAVEMMLVPGGSFRLAGSVYEVEPFLIDRFEVTNARVANFKNRQRPTGWPAKDPVHCELDRPVTKVSLDDARRFAAWADKRLPTVAQWRLAAGGTGVERTELRSFPWGNRPNQAKHQDPRHAPRVGSDPSDISLYGVLDLGRSVAEWCESDPRESKRGFACGGRNVRTLDERMSATFPTAELLRAEPRAAHERELARLGFRCVLPLVPRRR